MTSPDLSVARWLRKALVAPPSFLTMLLSHQL